MKVITFSRFFPAKHPRKGEPTYFVEKILAGLEIDEDFYLDNLLSKKIIDFDDLDTEPKHHTIREGNRWKVGDYFSPRVWSDLPYRSKKIIIAPPIEIKKIWDIEMYGMTTLLNDEPINSLTLHEIAKNDGLEYKDFDNWFDPLPFKGQIICWNDKIDY